MKVAAAAVCATSKKRLGIAEEMGAYATIATSECDPEEEMKKIHPGGTDVVIDATGIESCIQRCLRLARKGGHVLLAGYGRGKIMNTHDVNNLQIIGAGNNWSMHKLAATLMADGIIDLKPLVTNVMPLDHYQEALEMAEKRPLGFVKAVFKP